MKSLKKNVVTVMCLATSSSLVWAQPSLGLPEATPVPSQSSATTTRTATLAATPPPITGSGTANRIPLWTGTTTLGTSAIAQVDNHIGIGTTLPDSDALLTVRGVIATTGGLKFSNGTRQFSAGLTNLIANSGLSASISNGVATVGIAPGGVTPDKLVPAMRLPVLNSSQTGLIPKWNGSAWVAQPDNNSGGTVTGVVAQAPLTVTGIATKTPTLVLNTVPIEKGGTGATLPADARIKLGTAARGANTDITSLGGLTTPLSIAQGGTGAGQQNFVDLTSNQSNIGGDKTFTDSLTVNGTLNAFGLVPVGSVISWWGNSTQVPVGWKLCDGTAVNDARSPFNTIGIPDLRNKFVRGTTGDVRATPVSGGADSVDLAHTHSLTDAYAKVGVASGSNNFLFGYSAMPLSNEYRDSFTFDGNTNATRNGNYGNTALGGVTDSSLGITATVPSYVGLVYIIRIF